MNNKIEKETREYFSNWLRGHLRNLEFYQRRGKHYLIREFAKYCIEQGARIDEASLGRYLRDEKPVMPTPERCRALAKVLDMSAIHVLAHAGYITGADFNGAFPADIAPETLADTLLYRLAGCVPGEDRQQAQERQQERQD